MVYFLIQLFCRNQIHVSLHNIKDHWQMLPNWPNITFKTEDSAKLGNIVYLLPKAAPNWENHEFHWPKLVRQIEKSQPSTCVVHLKRVRFSFAFLVIRLLTFQGRICEKKAYPLKVHNTWVLRHKKVPEVCTAPTLLFNKNSLQKRAQIWYLLKSQSSLKVF